LLDLLSCFGSAKHASFFWIRGDATTRHHDDFARALIAEKIIYIHSERVVGREISTTTNTYHEVGQLLKGRPEKLIKFGPLSPHNVQQLLWLDIVIRVISKLNPNKGFYS